VLGFSFSTVLTQKRGGHILETALGKPVQTGCLSHIQGVLKVPTPSTYNVYNFFFYFQIKATKLGEANKVNFDGWFTAVLEKSRNLKWRLFSDHVVIFTSFDVIVSFCGREGGILGCSIHLPSFSVIALIFLS